MNIRKKLTLLSCGTLVLIFIVSMVSWLSVRRLLDVNEYVIHSGQVIQNALLMEKYIERLEINIRNCVIARGNTAKKQYESDKARLRDEIRILDTIIWTSSQRNIISNVSLKLEKWLRESDKFVKTLKKEADPEVVSKDLIRVSQGDIYLEKIRNTVKDFYYNEQKLLEERKNNEANTAYFTLSAIVYSSILILLIFAIFSFLISNRIRKPLNLSVKMMKNIAEGSADLSERINLKQYDEVGEFVKWFNMFMEKIQTIIISLKSEINILDEQVGYLSSASTGLANNSVANSSAIEHMNTAMEDLKQVTEVYHKTTTETLEENEKNISELMLDADDATNMTHVSAINDKLESVSEFLIDMNRQSSDMENFIRELKEISVQSKILSVNASVQASKAGEHGKGFSVIAQEIKNLSTNSELAIKNATKTFKSVQNLSQQCALTIENIQTKLFDFIKKAKSYSDEFIHKTELLGSISETINGLTVSRKQHLEGIRILSEAMSGIKDSTDNNAEGARKLETAAGSLSDLSSRLKENTENFKI